MIPQKNDLKIPQKIDYLYEMRIIILYFMRKYTRPLLTAFDSYHFFLYQFDYILLTYKILCQFNFNRYN